MTGGGAGACITMLGVGVGASGVGLLTCVGILCIGGWWGGWMEMPCVVVLLCATAAGFFVALVDGTGVPEQALIMTTSENSDKHNTI